MTKVLRAENLVKKYGDFYAVNDIDLNLNKGEVVGLLGPNGAGKTTTFYMITGMIRPSSGKIIFGDEDITKSPMYKRARMGIGYLAQEPSIFGKLSVEDNLKIVLETIIPNKEEQNQLIDKLLNEFNISQNNRNLDSLLIISENLKKINIILDKDSGEPRLSHKIDLSTGMYKGREIFKKKLKENN